MIDVAEAAVAAIAIGSLWAIKDRAIDWSIPTIGGFGWDCRRQEGESWPAYATRSLAVARERAPALVTEAEPLVGPEHEIVVALDLVTEHEVRLFDLPVSTRDTVRAAVADGAVPWPSSRTRGTHAASPSDTPVL